jgi:hypothetical protein
MQRVVRFFSYRAYTDSNHGDNLRYEWPLALCYHLIVCDVLLVGLVYNCYFDDDVDYLVDLCMFLHALIYRCKYDIILN